MAVSNLLFQTATRVWHLMPGLVRKNIRGAAHSATLYEIQRLYGGKKGPHKPGPLIVSGFLNEHFGIAKTGKTTIEGLEQAGFDVVPHDIREWLQPGPFGRQYLPQNADGGVLVMVCNAPEAMVALSRIRPADLQSVYRIGYWVYELPTLPEDWAKTARLFDELWAPTEFVAGMLRKVHERVRVMPYWLHAAAHDAALPPRDGSFVVSTAGDVRSSTTRKNISGAIAMFETAFPEPSSQARLRIKLSNTGEGISSLDPVFERVSRRGDVEIIDEHFSQAEMTSFIAASDVYLSAHRAEGYGLALAEAMQLGVVPLATGYSGNLDFMRPFPELLIDYELIDVEDPTGIYRPSEPQVWADPSVTDGARRLRALFERPEERRDIARRCQEHISSFNGRWSADSFAEARWTRLLRSAERKRA